MLDGNYRALQTSSNNGFAGTMLLHHPLGDTDNYMNNDRAFRDACCEIESEDDIYCQRFFQRRVINDCRGYVPPFVGKWSIVSYTL